MFYNNYNETRYPSPWGQQICFITTPRLLLLCLIWRQWLSSTRKNSDNAAVTFSTCDAWKLSPRSDHYHLWENHKGSLLWKSHISTKSLPFGNWQTSSFTPLNFQASGGEESSWWETSSWMRETDPGSSPEPDFHSASVPLVYLDLPLFCDFYSSV